MAAQMEDAMDIDIDIDMGADFEAPVEPELEVWRAKLHKQIPQT